MKRIGLFLILLVSTALSLQAQQAVPANVDPVAASLSAIRSGRIELAQRRAEFIQNPAARGFVQAYIEREKGNLKAALETIAKVVALYPNDRDWTTKSQLMSAALYMQLGMLESADVAARQIETLYEGTDAAAKATALRDRIKNLKAEQASEGSSE